MFCLWLFGVISTASERSTNVQPPKTKKQRDASPTQDMTSVSISALRQNSVRLCEPGRQQVEESRSGYQSQKGQILPQFIQPGDGDDAVRMKQPMTEENHQPFLLCHKVFEGLLERINHKRFRYVCVWEERQMCATHAAVVIYLDLRSRHVNRQGDQRQDQNNVGECVIW